MQPMAIKKFFFLHMCIFFCTFAAYIRIIVYNEIGESRKAWEMSRRDENTILNYLKNEKDSIVNARCSIVRKLRK